MRSFFFAFLAAALFLAAPAWPDEGHQHELTEQEVGSVHFPTSCSKRVQTAFQRAVALLHSFQYEQARKAFEQISKQDPTCAMAQWGLAMSYYHGLWGNSDLAPGRKAMAQARELAQQNRQTSARERGYIAALTEVYREDGDLAANAQAFEHGMAELQASYPDDKEAAIFHALALDIVASKTDKTFANQRKCLEILEPIFTKQPNHPGVAHYIIHCGDNTPLAEKALPAARKYAGIAPASAHANHMPSHIFTRLGLWDESVRSNLRAAELAALAESTSTSGEARDEHLHAFDYLEYAYLQMGRVQEAQAVLQAMNSLPPVSGLTHVGDYALAAVPARRALEMGEWDAAAHLQARTEAVPWAQAISWMAIGVGASRSKDLTRASQAEKNLARLRDATAASNAYWSQQIEVQRLEVAAWILQASGQPAQATAAMAAAAELEDSTDKAPVTPGPVIPAREMLGQMLTEQERPADALTEFEAVLRTAPNRFNALWGAASSAEAAGNAGAAVHYFRKLSETGVGSERPELETARKKAGNLAQN